MLHKLLLVEDDTILQKTLKNVLTKEYELDLSSSLIEAHDKIEKGTYSLFMIDIVFPNEVDQSGFDLCKAIRAQNINAPILIITGKHAINYKLGAFKFGADDYLCKPFNLLELKARINALIRRSQEIADQSEVLTYKSLRIDKNAREVLINKQKVTLRKKEFEILKLLIENRGKVLTRDQILQQLWNTFDVTNNTVDVHIRNIRSKISNDKLIETVYGLGYIIK